jgi:dethiobiotin synthetase
MSTRIVVAGTDTDIGKTVFSAALTQALDGYYWKPVQAGLASETDSETVVRLSGLPPSRILPEAYKLNTPASPHFAAELDGIEIDASRLRPQDHPTPLVIELAGGLDVPLTRGLLQVDLLAEWKIPIVLCSSTRLHRRTSQRNAMALRSTPRGCARRIIRHRSLSKRQAAWTCP